MHLKGSGARMSDALCRPVLPCVALCRPVAACRTGLGPPNIKISDPGGLDLEAWCLDAWMLAGLEWIGGGDGGDWNGRRGLEEIPTRSSFRSSADIEHACGVTLLHPQSPPLLPASHIYSHRFL